MPSPKSSYTRIRLSPRLLRYLRGDISPPEIEQQDNVFQSVLANYTTPPWLSKPLKIPSGGTVLLTGGTGALGCHLLAQLASSTSLDRIIVLNLSLNNINPYTRQFKSSKEKGAHIPLSMIEKVEILQTNTALPISALLSPYIGDSPLLSRISFTMHSR